MESNNCINCLVWTASPLLELARICDVVFPHQEDSNPVDCVGGAAIRGGTGGAAGCTRLRVRVVVVVAAVLVAGAGAPVARPPIPEAHSEEDM
mmetsp:Transcript_763/g.1801  ORF Transcript_763/g.1801 Transcript_763/m.1801 type:complete len:93 (+) Transcript_763:638-916(+)